ncbi:hypothetical protein HBH53_264170, partial [Parastagonospora nodorum]
GLGLATRRSAAQLVAVILPLSVLTGWLFKAESLLLPFDAFYIAVWIVGLAIQTIGEGCWHNASLIVPSLTCKTICPIEVFPQTLLGNDKKISSIYYSMGERLAGECVAGIERYISSAIINDGPVQSAYAHFL